MLVLTAAIPKPGPTVALVLNNKTINQTASVALNGLTNFYTYYLTAKPYAITVKYPGTWQRLPWTGAIKGNDVTYSVRADFYEAVVYACGNPGAKGVMNLTHNVKLTFPLCDKAKASKTGLGNSVGGINQGEPTQEKISTSRMFPGYWDPGHTCAYADGINSPISVTGAAWNTKGNSVAGTAVVGGGVCRVFVDNDKYVGDGFSDGTLKGAYYYSHNGAQVRWMLDFQNW
ncbi:MAG: hypothetical protein WCI88_16610, partial [Chloroflexota bacterium]